MGEALPCGAAGPWTRDDTLAPFDGCLTMAEHRLMVVEDDPTTRNVLRKNYTRMGWQVSMAGTGAEAMALLDSEPEPCCMILDVMLPDGDGFEVLKKVRAKALRTRVVG